MTDITTLSQRLNTRTLHFCFTDSRHLWRLAAALAV